MAETLEQLIVRNQQQMDQQWAGIVRMVSENMGRMGALAARLCEQAGRGDGKECLRFLASLSELDAVTVVLMAQTGMREAILRESQWALENTETDRE